MFYLAFQNITLFDYRFLREDSIQIHLLSQRVCFWLVPATKNVKRGRLDLIKDRVHVILSLSQTTLRVAPFLDLKLEVFITDSLKVYPAPLLTLLTRLCRCRQFTRQTTVFKGPNLDHLINQTR